MYQIKSTHCKFSNYQQIKNIEFVVKDAYEDEEEGHRDSPYINLADPKKDFEKLEKPDEQVIDADKVVILYGYPLKEQYMVEYSSDSGFTRKQLAEFISSTYQQIYRDELSSSTVNVKTMKERKATQNGLMNRNKTNGTYGIWGHDLSDLVLHTLGIYRNPNNKYMIQLGIDS